jgi:hypothetical protein
MESQTINALITVRRRFFKKKSRYSLLRKKIEVLLSIRTNFNIGDILITQFFTIFVRPFNKVKISIR